LRKGKKKGSKRDYTSRFSYARRKGKLSWRAKKKGEKVARLILPLVIFYCAYEEEKRGKKKEVTPLNSSHVTKGKGKGKGIRSFLSQGKRGRGGGTLTF